MKKLLSLLLVFFTLPLFASGPHHKSSSSSSSGKTVHVRSYNKKDGTHVDSYNRRPPRHHK